MQNNASHIRFSQNDKASFDTFPYIFLIFQDLMLLLAYLNLYSCLRLRDQGDQSDSPLKSKETRNID